MPSPVANQTKQYDFRIPLEVRIKENCQLSAEEIKSLIFAKVVELLHGRHVTMFDTREVMEDHQTESAKDKANQYAGWKRAAVLTLSVSFSMLAAIGPQQAFGIVCQAFGQGASKVDDILYQDGRGFSVTLIQHSHDRLEKVNQEFGQKVQQTFTDCRQAYEEQKQHDEQMQRAFMSIASN